MTAQHEHLLQKVRQWTDFAEEDLRLAEHGLCMGEESPHRLVAYHAQQCAEKYLKAYLVPAGNDFPFTHNVSLLLELCEEQPTWAQRLQAAEGLSRYAITTRYPGEDRRVTPQEARAAVATATDVRETVRAELVRLGVDL